MADVFLSYSREDQATARRFAEGLQGEGLTVWWDQTLRSGETYDRVTERALADARAVVVLWSRASVESKWVRSEATQADRGGTLVPVMIEPCKRPIMFELNQTADLSGWLGDLSDARWVAFIDDVRAATGSRESATAPALAPARTMTARKGWRGLQVAAAAIVLGVAGAGLWAFMQRPAAPVLSTGVAAAGKPAQNLTIAVLPLVNLTSDPEQEYFVDGLTEELLNSLAGVSGLQVTSRTSSFYFKGKNEEMKVIGEKLGVDHILEGTVRRSGDQVRIVAKLVKAKDGFQVWSQTFNRPITDVFKVQEEIATSVAEALQISLGVGELGRTPGMTHDIEAYQAYAEARARSGQMDAQATVIERLKYAVERDPNFMQAWLELSGRYRFMSNFGSSEQSREMLRLAEEAQAQAARVSPDPRFIKLITGGVPFQRGEWSAMERQWRERKAEIEALNLRSLVAPTGPPDTYRIAEDKARQAIAGLERARARDPLNLRIATNLAEAYANSGLIPEAIAEQTRGMQIATDELLLLSALYTAKATGDPAHVERSWQALISTPEGARYAWLHALRDRPTEALAELQRSGQISPLWAAFFGDDELALKLLEAENNPDRRFATAMMLWRPLMEGVRKAPGFKDVVRGLGLVDYWREFGWGEHCRPVGETDFECN
jgi:TolB-like protein